MKLFRFYIIYRFAQDAITAAKIYNMLYNNENLKDSFEIKNTTKPAVKSNMNTTKQKSKKDEIIDSLNYLKSKKSPTKQDKDSIYTLQMILKNM